MPAQDLSTISYRLDAVEKQIAHLVPEKENDLRFQAMVDTVERIEKQIAAMKEAQDKFKSDVDKLQIRVLAGILTTIVGIAGYILINYLNHLP